MISWFIVCKDSKYCLILKKLIHVLGSTCIIIKFIGNRKTNCLQRFGVMELSRSISLRKLGTIYEEPKSVIVIKSGNFLVRGTGEWRKGQH